jgi:penicillin-binding protein 1A
VATRMGISSPLTAVPSIALGTQEVNLLELTSAYAPFANGGMGVIPNVITSIAAKDGTVLYQASDAGPGRVIAPNVLAEMNDMLETAVEVGTGKGANLNGWQFGGKTGTSQSARDALFIGYTAAMVTGVWLGNDDDTKTTLSGGNVPAAIWSEFMTKAHEGKQIAQIPGGSYEGQLVAQPVIDPATGQAAIDPATGQPMTQYVDAGTGQPVQTSVDPTTGQLMRLDPATGQYVAANGTLQANQPIQTGQMVDPNTGLPAAGAIVDANGVQIDPATGLPVANSGGGMLVDANGVQIDPTTGLPVGQVVGGNQIVQGQAIDPVTGFPLQQQSNGVGQAPLDPNTGQPMVLVVDPATGQQVWVPSAPAQMQPPANLGQPVPIENERSQRTLMDLIFGDQQN